MKRNLLGLFLMCMMCFSASAQKSQSLPKTRVCIWEFFDVKTLPDSCLLLNEKEINGNQKDDDQNGYIDDYYGIGFDYKELPTSHNFTPSYERDLDQNLYWHGTAVANVVVKYNPNVQLMGVGFIRYVERKYADDMLSNFKERMKDMAADARLICKMLETGAKYFHDRKAQVVNISWMGDPPIFKRIFAEYDIDTLKREKEILDWVQAFEDCLRGIFLKYPDIVFVIAAGNDNDDVVKRKVVPANIDLPNVIVVGGKKNAQERCSFSNYGKNVHVYAPCSGIFKINQKEKFFMEGTSFSAPVVTAWVALQLSKGLSIPQIKQKAERLGFINKDNFND